MILINLNYRTSLLRTFYKGYWVEGYTPTIFDNALKDYSLQFLGFNASTHITIDSWDTAGQEEFDCFRPLTYHYTDVFMLCFDISNQKSLDHIKTKWLPELVYHYKTTNNGKIMLIATKCDIKKDNKDVCRNGKPVTTIIPNDTIDDFIWRIKVNESFKQTFYNNQVDIPYIETSSYDKTNLIKAFETAITLGFRQIGANWMISTMNMHRFTSSNSSNSYNCLSKFVRCVCRICCFNYCCGGCCNCCNCCNCCSTTSCCACDHHVHATVKKNENESDYNGDVRWVSVGIVGKGERNQKKELIICDNNSGTPFCDHQQCNKYIIDKKVKIGDLDRINIGEPLTITTICESGRGFKHVNLYLCGDGDDNSKEKLGEWIKFINDYQIDWNFNIRLMTFGWEKQRIIWIGYLKNDENKQCLLAKLPKDLIKVILSFLCMI